MYVRIDATFFVIGGFFYGLYIYHCMIGRAIIETLAYFDVFDMPLTKEEVCKWLWKQKATLFEVNNMLDILYTESKISYAHGFYCLLGREDIIERRRLAVTIIDKKMDIATKATKRLRWIPFFQAMFVCNTVASSSASHCSDIDVFIVVKRDRLWLTRIFVTLTLSLFRMRRTKKHVTNRICLSFYVTDAHLDLSDVTIGEPDIYLVYWIDQLIPIYDPINILEDIFKKNNWAHTYLPNAFKHFILHPRWRVVDGVIAKKIRVMFETVWGGGYGDLLEAQAKSAQKKKMEMNLLSVRDQNDSRVVVNDTMFKFHENDRREYFREEWRKRVEKYFL